MIVFIYLVTLCCLMLTATSQDSKYRPNIHFTPVQNWMNDPNGMVYYQGQYHLFYQYNPYGNTWGHMSWGHAVSKDMIVWQHLPLAIPQQNGVMIFSGSAVVDWNNTSQLGTKENPPMIAIYTGNDQNLNQQYQCIAFSTDKGRTWTKYSQNPVISLKLPDFRDPKVFWYEKGQKWVMVVSLPTQRKLQFYSSENLINWKFMSTFGPSGATSPIWQCPDLFQIKVENSTETKWMLIVNLGSTQQFQGSSTMQFIGQFDGQTFVSDQDFELVDLGRDYYAAVTWDGIPKEDGRTLWLGWMNNWQYANQIPTGSWRSSMSVPRSMKIWKNENKYFLKQQPVVELNNYKSLLFSLSQASLADLNLNLNEFRKVNLQFVLELEIYFVRQSPFSFSFGDKNNPSLILTYDGISQGTISRPKSGNNFNNSNFPSTRAYGIPISKKSLKMTIIADKVSVQIFLQEGLKVFTNLVYPFIDNPSVFINGNGADVIISKAVFSSYKGIKSQFRREQ